MAEETSNSTSQSSDAEASTEEQVNGKAIKKTYLEIREEARRAILSGHDREKYESQEPDEQKFVNTACLYEFNSQKVRQTKRKIKLREIMLCRDVAAAYCSGKDLTGQYSEGKRILKNTEAGGKTVRFVLARKICSMLERIYNLYSSHPRSYVSADLHRAETELLNYTSRLGKIIRDPLNQARRIYLQLQERTGWDIPSSAFGNAEGCDVPQLFFNRYSDPNQLLLKDPLKPFRSDNLEPPLKLDYRIKNAVLIVAGENRFYLDKKKFATVRDSATARAIMLKGLEEAREKIGEVYRTDTYELVDRLSAEDEINVPSIKELAFQFFYGYTLTNLPNTAARVDAAELFIQKLMEQENEIGCRGFTKCVFPPGSIRDDTNPDYWSPEYTEAYKLRCVFNEIGTGEARLSMFAMKMTELLTEYLDGQLKAIKERLEAPFKHKIDASEKRLQEFLETHGKDTEQSDEISEKFDRLVQKRRELIDESLSMIQNTFKKSLKADSDQGETELIQRIMPRLTEEAAKRDEIVGKLKERYQALANKNNSLADQVKKIDGLREQAKQNPADPALKEAERELFTLNSNMSPDGKTPNTLPELRNLIVAQANKVRAGLDKIKERHAAALRVAKSLKEMISKIQEVENLAEKIAPLQQQQEAIQTLLRQKQSLVAEIDQSKSEQDECISRIEDAIEANQES